jgi:hypothetical protein
MEGINKTKEYTDYSEADIKRLKNSIASKKAGETLSLEESTFLRLEKEYWAEDDQPQWH